MRTPAWRGTLIAHAVLLYLAAPLAAALYFREQATRGIYPVNADSIALPIYGTTIFLAVVSPLVLTVLLLALRGYRGGVSWSYLDRDRPLPSLAWSLLFGGSGLAALYLGVSDLVDGHLAPGLHALAVAHLCVLLRAAAVGSRGVEPVRVARGPAITVVLGAAALATHLFGAFSGFGLAEDYPWFGKLYWSAGTLVPHALVLCALWVGGASGAVYGMTAAVLVGQALMHLAFAADGDLGAKVLFFGAAAQVYFLLPPAALAGQFAFALFVEPAKEP